MAGCMPEINKKEDSESSINTLYTVALEHESALTAERRHTLDSRAFSLRLMPPSLEDLVA